MPSWHVTCIFIEKCLSVCLQFLFLVHLLHLLHILRQFKYICYHCYADDIKLYIVFKPQDVSKLLSLYVDSINLEVIF